MANNMVNYKFSRGGAVLTIYDSYKVSKHDFQKTLNSIKAIHGDEPIFERCDFSLKMELITHNFLYKLGYKRERTKDADLDIPCDKPEWVYIILGILVWVFVK